MEAKNAGMQITAHFIIRNDYRFRRVLLIWWSLELLFTLEHVVVDLVRSEFCVAAAVRRRFRAAGVVRRGFGRKKYDGLFLSESAKRFSRETAEAAWKWPEPLRNEEG